MAYDIVQDAVQNTTGFVVKVGGTVYAGPASTSGWDYVNLTCPICEESSDFGQSGDMWRWVSHHTNRCMKDLVIDFCPDCGAIMWKGEQDYVSDYPNGSDLAREQAARRHRAHECPAADHSADDITCPDCGALVGSWDEEYRWENPNGFDMAVSQAMEEHRRECPAEWQEWLTECRKVVPGLTIPGDITPRGLLRLLLETNNQIYMKDIPCPPDRGPNHYWPEGDLIGIVDVAKTRRRLEDRLRKDEVEVMEVALSLGVAVELKGGAV